MFVELLEEYSGFEAGIQDVPAQTARMLIRKGKARKPIAKKPVEKRETRAKRTKAKKGTNKGANTSKRGKATS